MTVGDLLKRKFGGPHKKKTTQEPTTAGGGQHITINISGSDLVAQPASVDNTIGVDNNDTPVTPKKGRNINIKITVH